MFICFAHFSSPSAVIIAVGGTDRFGQPFCDHFALKTKNWRGGLLATRHRRKRRGNSDRMIKGSRLVQEEVLQRVFSITHVERLIVYSNLTTNQPQAPHLLQRCERRLQIRNQIARKPVGPFQVLKQIREVVFALVQVQNVIANSAG